MEEEIKSERGLKSSWEDIDQQLEQIFQKDNAIKEINDKWTAKRVCRPMNKKELEKSLEGLNFPDFDYDACLEKIKDKIKPQKRDEFNPYDNPVDLDDIKRPLPVILDKYDPYNCDYDDRGFYQYQEYPKNNFVDSLETDDYFEDEICLKIHPDKVDKDMIDNLFNNIDYDIRKDKYSSRELKEIDLPMDYDVINQMTEKINNIKEE